MSSMFTVWLAVKLVNVIIILHPNRNPVTFLEKYQYVFLLLSESDRSCDNGAWKCVRDHKNERQKTIFLHKCDFSDWVQRNKMLPFFKAATEKCVYQTNPYYMVLKTCENHCLLFGMNACFYLAIYISSFVLLKNNYQNFLTQNGIARQRLLCRACDYVPFIQFPIILLHRWFYSLIRFYF